jgi:hypothetical protein
MWKVTPGKRRETLHLKRKGTRERLGKSGLIQSKDQQES